MSAVADRCPVTDRSLGPRLYGEDLSPASGAFARTNCVFWAGRA